MITYGSRVKTTHQPAKETASAWDAFRAKVKLTAAKSTTVAAENEVFTSTKSHVNEDGQDDGEDLESGDLETTPRASRKNALIDTGLKGRGLCTNSSTLASKQHQRKRNQKEASSKSRVGRDTEEQSPKSASTLLPPCPPQKSKPASLANQKGKIQATSENGRKRKISDKNQSGEDALIANYEQVTTRPIYNAPPSLLNQELGSDFQLMVQETTAAMMATEEEEDNLGTFDEQDQLDSQASSTNSSIFDMFLKSPVKEAKKARRVGRMERLTTITSSPNDAESSQKRTVTRKLPPQYEFKETAISASKSNQHYNSGQASPSGMKSDSDPSPNKREKERLLLHRPATTITYGRQEGTLGLKLNTRAISTTFAANPTSLSTTTCSEASSATVTAAPTALEDLMQRLDADTTVQIDEGLESSDDELPRIQGFHELRAAGNSKQILDELNYIFEGVFSPEVKIKRSSCFDLIKKLKKESILNSIRIHGKVKDIFAGLKSCDDSIVRTSLCFILCILGPKNLESIINQEMVNWLFDSLSRSISDDILVKLPKKKYERALVMDLIDLIKSYTKFPLPITTPHPLIVLAVSILQSSCFAIEERLADNIMTFVKKESLKDAPSGFLISLAGEEEEGGEESISLPAACLTILERVSMNQSHCHTIMDDLVFQTHFTSHFFTCLSQMTTPTTLTKLWDMDKVNQVQYMLRLLINLTGPKRQSILSFSKSQITVLFKGFLDVERIIDDEVKVMGGKRDGVEKWIDVQSLILVLLINICGKEGSDGPLLIANYEHNGKTGLEWTASIYDSIFVQASEAVYPANKFRCSYMAVFLSILVKNGPAFVRNFMESHLACNSFESVLLTLKEFLSLHQAVQNAEGGAQEEIVVLLIDLVRLLS